MPDSLVDLEGRLLRLPLPPTPSVLLVVLATLVVFVARRRRTPTELRPPGPIPHPIVGNSLQVPIYHFAEYLKRLHEQYGGLVYLNINGTHTYSVGDIELANELFERRSIIYSSRPCTPLIERYIDPSGFMWALAKQGENHYWGRRLSAIVMKLVRMGHSEPLQRMEALSMVHKLLDTEEPTTAWWKYISQVSAGVTVAAMFGVNSRNGEAPEVEKVIKLVENVVDVGSPLASIINVFPFIDIIPSAVPGVPWRKRAANWVRNDRKGWNELFHEALEGQGAGLGTWTSIFAQEKTEDGGDRRYLVTNFAAAAIETTATALQSFIFACCAYPEWISEAQKELDNVVGKERLPDFHDRSSLPFIEAVVRETLRWNPPIRHGLPRQITADDVVQYKGKEYLIPRGSMIHVPAYVMEHDKSRFEDPHVFHPQRFLDEHGQLKEDYQTSTFGFGRRLCVGIPFAERSMWITIATLLWTFHIRKPADPLTGVRTPCEVSEATFDGRVTNPPHPFAVEFEPRDEGRIVVARREWEECEKDVKVLLPPLSLDKDE